MKISTLKRTLAIVAAALFVGALLWTTVWLIVSRQMTNLENYRGTITQTLSNALNRPVSYDKAEAVITLRAGLSLRLTRMEIGDHEEAEPLALIEQAFFRVNLIPLLINRMVFREALFDHPRLTLSRNPEGIWNISDLLESSGDTFSFGLRKVTISRGYLTFFDHSPDGKTRTTALENLHCDILPPRMGGIYRFRLQADIREEEKDIARVSVEGNYRLPASPRPVHDGYLDAAIHVLALNLDHYHPYFIERLPFTRLTGRVDVDATITGVRSRFTSKGKLTLTGGRLDFQQVFLYPIEPERVELDYGVSFDAGRLDIDIVRLDADGVILTGGVSLHDLDSDDPLLSVSARVKGLSRRDVSVYVPWALTPASLVSFLDAHVLSGTYDLTEGRLHGRISEIAGINQPQNADVLYIRAEARDAVFDVGSKTPRFSQIEGVMEIKNRRFSLSNTRALFGASPCRLDGIISDWAEGAPLLFDAELTVVPDRDAVLWLTGQDKQSKLAFSGDTQVVLTGSGPADHFRIHGRWDLGGADYAWPGLIHKPARRENRLSAAITILPSGIDVPAFSYDLGSLNLSGDMRFRFDGKVPVNMTLQSDGLDLRDMSDMVPTLKNLEIAGTAAMDISAAGNLADRSSLRWTGHATVSDGSLRPYPSARPLGGLSGRADFHGDRMETTVFKGRMGTSRVGATCAVADFGKPAVACRFAAPAVSSVDIGFQLSGDAATEPVIFRDVTVIAAYDGQAVTLGQLTAKVGQSVFNLSGSIGSGARPEMDLTLHIPVAYDEDVFRLVALRPQKPTGTIASPIRLTARVTADSLNLKQARLHKLRLSVTFADGVWDITKLQTGALGGAMTATGKIHLSPDGKHRYETAVSFFWISLEGLLSFLEVADDRVLTGKLLLAARLSASGDNVDEMVRTLGGVVQIRAEDGVLKKFPVLSKVFSVLNVAQLFNFRLPDMAKDGMPYDNISVELAIEKGIAVFNDFLIDSKAMQISAVGSLYLPEKKIQSTLGVHPLQTIDRIAARIPVAGWILTDEKGKLITVHFRTDGPWEDPVVTPIPAESLARGTLNIFRRIFQLPEKLITDTGDVLLGR